jgi:NCAIR mutase (PurE)-related protein
MKEILERLLAGEFSVDEALRALEAEHVEQVGELARLDPDRMRRKGVPEVVLAPGKAPALTAELAVRLLDHAGLALVSRVGAEHDEALRAAARAAGAGVDVFGSGRRLRRAEAPGPGTGAIGILTGGSSDVDVAEEARMVAETMGVRVLRAYDVGISAVHRLAEPLAAMVEADVDALVVVAGMEGALPTLVGGLVSAPVVAVPTSAGYGAGGGGLAAP